MIIEINFPHFTLPWLYLQFIHSVLFHTFKDMITVYTFINRKSVYVFQY